MQGVLLDLPSVSLTMALSWLPKLLKIILAWHLSFCDVAC